MKNFFESSIKTSRLFNLTAGHRGSPLFAKKKTRPRKITPVPLSSFGFATESLQ